MKDWERGRPQVDKQTVPNRLCWYPHRQAYGHTSNGESSKFLTLLHVDPRVIKPADSKDGGSSSLYLTCRWTRNAKRAHNLRGKGRGRLPIIKCLLGAKHCYIYMCVFMKFHLILSATHLIDKETKVQRNYKIFNTNSSTVMVIGCNRDQPLRASWTISSWDCDTLSGNPALLGPRAPLQFGEMHSHCKVIIHVILAFQKWWKSHLGVCISPKPERWDRPLKNYGSLWKSREEKRCPSCFPTTPQFTYTRTPLHCNRTGKFYLNDTSHRVGSPARKKCSRSGHRSANPIKGIILGPVLPTGNF